MMETIMLNPIPMRVVDTYHDMLAQRDIIPLGTVVVYRTEYYNWQWLRTDCELGYEILSKTLRDDLQEKIDYLESKKESIDSQIGYLKGLQKLKKKGK